VITCPSCSFRAAMSAATVAICLLLRMAAR
jgi:hypothetical protein